MTGELSRRTFLRGMAGTAGAVLLGGCNPGRPEPPAGGRPTVRVQEWTSLGFPSPFTYTAGPGYWRMSLLYDTLTWPDSTGTQLPWLASSYRRSEDGGSYGRTTELVTPSSGISNLEVAAGFRSDLAVALDTVE